VQWYYAENGQHVGPLNQAEVRQLYAGGTITGETLVWRPGWPAWRPFHNLAAEELSSEANVQCSECGNVFPASDVIAFEGASICANCKPLFFQKLREGAPVHHDVAYGGFWIRVLARLLDGLILQSINLLYGVGMALVLRSPRLQMIGIFINMGASVAVGASYEIGFTGRFGATPGKMACRLRIVMADGARLSYGRATGRYFAQFLSSMTLLIGYLMVAFDDEKRALHDRVCDTRVIRLDT
jgi:uncharacterized RDD family membrane protein YckC